MMGRVLVEISVENLEDTIECRKGRISESAIRRMAIPEALVDTGATMLSLPSHVISQLGLEKFSRKRARTTAGSREFWVYSPVKLTVQGRDCHVDVAEVPDDCPALLGQVPLELMDFVIDPNARRLIGNPEHGGEEMMDMF